MNVNLLQLHRLSSKQFLRRAIDYAQVFNTSALRREHYAGDSRQVQVNSKHAPLGMLLGELQQVLAHAEADLQYMTARQPSLRFSAG